jgi:DnaJ homolog subfamily C member 2
VVPLTTLDHLRWEKVSSVVPGKTKAQCFKRFKELKDVFKAKKAGGAAGGEGDE